MIFGDEVLGIGARGWVLGDRGLFCMFCVVVADISIAMKGFGGSFLASILRKRLWYIPPGFLIFIHILDVICQI